MGKGKQIRSAVFLNNLKINEKTFVNNEGEKIFYKEYVALDENGNETKRLTSSKVMTPSKINELSKELSGSFLITPNNLANSLAKRWFSLETISNLNDAQIKYDDFIKNAVELGVEYHKLAEDGRFDSDIQNISTFKSAGMYKEYRESNGALLTSWNFPNGYSINVSYLPDLIIEINPAFANSEKHYDPKESDWIIVDYKATNSSYSFKASRQLTVGALVLARVLTNNVEEEKKLYNKIQTTLIEISKPKENVEASTFINKTKTINLQKFSYQTAVKFVIGASMFGSSQKEMNAVIPDQYAITKK